MTSDAVSLQRSLASLRRFAREARRTETCGLCGTELLADHAHVLEMSTQNLVCCCQACAILFGNQTQGRFRGLPERNRYLPDVRMTDAEWDALDIPVDLAFVYRSAATEKMVAYYPGPFGVVESSLELDAWEEFVRTHAELSHLEPEVEAVLVQKREGKRDFFRVPITTCRKLIGLLRRNWEGLSGGTRVRQEIDDFFDRLRDESNPTRDSRS